MPLEDIGFLLVESRLTTMSTALMDACVQNKISVMVCDKKHLPSGMLQPYQQHSRQSHVIKSQLAMTEPLKKKLWQSIVLQKIKNQMMVCRSIKKGDVLADFAYYLKTVQSGDPLNREATVARLYFSTLFPKGVTRGSEHVWNAALNYGYAIIRGAMARSLAGFGFLTSIGIMHTNELDNFALADDLMEPYRPYVDHLVFSSIDPAALELTKEIRDSLTAILTKDVKIDGKSHSLIRAIELTAQSLVTAVGEKNSNKLLLPDFV